MVNFEWYIGDPKQEAFKIFLKRFIEEDYQKQVKADQVGIHTPLA